MWGRSGLHSSPGLSCLHVRGRQLQELATDHSIADKALRGLICSPQTNALVVDVPLGFQGRVDLSREPLFSEEDIPRGRKLQRYHTPSGSIFKA